MSKLFAYQKATGAPIDGYLFMCPACECMHQFKVPQWTFNGDMEKPTFNPSLKYDSLGCHLYVRDGMIQFLSDCKHKLAGKTVEIPEIDL